MTYIRLKMESPLLVAGKNLTGNYKESLPYISGDRVRAGFAKYILQNCPIYEVNKKEVVDKKENKIRSNWVYYRNEKECEKCSFSQVCKEFSNMKFSFFYPEGTEVLPFTAMQCKYNKEHGFKDILIRHEKSVCEKCIKKDETSTLGRMEAVYGLRKCGKVFNIDKVMYTRNAINKYTKTSKESALYSIVAVKNDYFEGEVRGIENCIELLKEFDVRIGSYTSVGMGLAKIEVNNKKKKAKKEDLYVKLREFNERIKKEDYFKEYDENFNYIPILFKSDTKLGLEKEKTDDYLSDDEYRDVWKRILKRDIDFEFEVERVCTETENYAGYDLSKNPSNVKEEIVVLNKMGTTILLKTNTNLKDLVESLIQIQIEGIGFERENGFGEVEICNELHLKGEIYE